MLKLVPAQDMEKFHPPWTPYTYKIFYIIKIDPKDSSYTILKDFRNSPPDQMLIHCQNVVF